MWNPCWQPGQGSWPLPKPFGSWHGPNVPSELGCFMVPQCSVPECVLWPLMASRMSISPSAGQVAEFSPSIQNAGQYPRPPAGSGCSMVALTRVCRPGAGVNRRLVCRRPDVQLVPGAPLAP
ncbi:MAG TPA: hypothetical protein VGG75_23795 [Trebonia sp.]